MNIVGFIPARYASTRFPGKPLIDIQGKTMIQRVYEQACKATQLSAVHVLTDDERIFAHVTDFGGRVLMTRSDHRSGTDRILEAVQSIECDACINIQGDEPFIAPEQIDLVAAPFFTRQGAFVSTLIHKISDLRELEMPSIIKVVVRQDGEALYFSRSAIPFLRDEQQRDAWIAQHGFWKHIGIYGYSAEALKRIPAFAPGVLEVAESLEQLRWMENGIPVITAITEHESISIDTPEDLERIASCE